MQIVVVSSYRSKALLMFPKGDCIVHVEKCDKVAQVGFSHCAHSRKFSVDMDGTVTLNQFDV